MVRKKVLINFVYYRPVGHVIEAIKYAKGISLANKNVDISIVLNKDTAYELTRACPWIKKTYTIDLDEYKSKNLKLKSLKKIPKKWNYIISDHRSKKFGSHKDEILMKKHYLESMNYFDSENNLYTDELPGSKIKGLKYEPNSQVIFDLPRNLKNKYKKIVGKGFNICIMLAGSANAGEYPKIESWKKIIDKVKDKFPSAKINITGYIKKRGSRTYTAAYTMNEVKWLIKETNSNNFYNIGLWNQISLINACDLFISPHTGFAFIAPCVGTPWLAISGGNWPEYLFNNIPFYSCLPPTKEYPFYTSKIDLDKLNYEKKREVAFMDEKGIEIRIPKIIEGIKLLKDKNFTYDKAVKKHIKNIKDSGINRKALFSFDKTLTKKFKS